MTDTRVAAVCNGKEGRAGIRSYSRHGLACVQTVPDLLYTPEGWVTADTASERRVTSWQNFGGFGSAWDLGQADADRRPWIYFDGYGDGDEWAWFYEDANPGTFPTLPPNPGARQFERWLYVEQILTGQSGRVMLSLVSRRQDDGDPTLFCQNERGLVVSGGSHMRCILRVYGSSKIGLGWARRNTTKSPDWVMRRDSSEIATNTPIVAEFSHEGGSGPQQGLVNNADGGGLTTLVVNSGGADEWWGDGQSHTHFVLGSDRVVGTDSLAVAGNHHYGGMQFVLAWDTSEVPSAAILTTLRRFLAAAAGATLA